MNHKQNLVNSWMKRAIELQKRVTITIEDEQQWYDHFCKLQNSFAKMIKTVTCYEPDYIDCEGLPICITFVEGNTVIDVKLPENIDEWLWTIESQIDDVILELFNA